MLMCSSLNWAAANVRACAANTQPVDPQPLGLRPETLVAIGGTLVTSLGKHQILGQAASHAACGLSLGINNSPDQIHSLFAPSVATWKINQPIAERNVEFQNRIPRQGQQTVPL